MNSQWRGHSFAELVHVADRKLDEYHAQGMPVAAEVNALINLMVELGEESLRQGILKDWLQPGNSYSVALDSYVDATREELWELLEEVVPRLHKLQIELSDVRYKACFELEYLRSCLLSSREEAGT